MKTRWCMIMLLGALAQSCGASRPVHYYRMDLPAEAAPVSEAVLGIALQVGNIDAPPIMRDGRILYQAGSNQIGAYEYHRWVETPDRMVQNSLLRLLRSSGKYQSVDTSTSGARADYIVLGKIYEFAEIDKPEIFARVSMEIELHDGRTRRTVWSRVYVSEEMVSGREVPDVVRSLEQNLRKGLAEIVSGIDRYFAERQTAGAPPS